MEERFFGKLRIACDFGKEIKVKAVGACLLGIGSHLKFSKLGHVVDLSAAFTI